MIEQQLRDGLRAAVADEPPLGFDPDRVADDARRAVRRRRAVLASAGATVLVIGAIVGTASLGSPAPGQRDPAGPASSVPVPPPRTSSTVPPHDPGQDPLGLEPQAERIGAHVSRVLPDVVPGARNAVARNHGQEAIGDYSLGNWLNFVVTYDDAEGRAVLAVQVFGPGRQVSIPLCDHVPAQRCAPATQPDGSKVFFHESAAEGAPARRGRTAYHEHAGSTAMVTTYTYDMNDRSRGAPVRDDFPLTDDQLVRLVTDPALALSP